MFSQNKLTQDKAKNIAALLLVCLVYLFFNGKQVFAATFEIAPNDISGLITAINSANQNDSSDTINLAPNSTYTIQVVNNNDYQPSGLPIISTEITINGNSSVILREIVSPKYRIFALVAPGILTINNLEIKGGYCTDHPLYGGGGIFNLNGHLTLNNVVVSNNVSETGGAGGVWVGDGATTTINDSNISNNSVFGPASGGGILKRGSGIVNIVNSTLAGNFAQNNGGAIYSQGTINLENSSVLNNQAENNGGAIFNYSGEITIDSSDISDNEVTKTYFGRGGGVYNNSLANIAVTNTTFSNNSVPINGGAFYNIGAASVNNSCFSGNSSTSFVNLGPLLDATNNWWGATDGPSGIGSGSGDSISGSVNYIPFISTATCSFGSVAEKTPIVLLPGFGGSWNTAAIISGGEGGSWKKTPYVKVYDNLQNTFLDNAGYTEGEDYFEFYYDWRKDLDTLADEFKDYLANIVLAGEPEGTKANLVGHSMGGMVVRAYAQKYGTDKVDEIVTVGSPHSGVPKAWQAWMGAEIGDRWSWQWIALQLLLQTQKPNYLSPVQAIRTLVPSLKELMPTLDFLKQDSDESVISFADLSEQNTYLAGLNDSISEDLKNIFNTLVGLENDINRDTIEWFRVGERSLTDRLLGKWADGKPVGQEYTSEGDLTVLAKSASMSAVLSAPLVSANHTDMIGIEAGIQTILDALEITGVSPATDSPSLPRNPSLVFFLRSPAEIKVTAPDGSQVGYGVGLPMSNAVYSPEDKLLVIYNAIDGDYQIEVVGTDEGDYHLDLGQLTESGEKWATIQDSTSAGESDYYTISFNANTPTDQPLVDSTGKTQLLLARQRFEVLKQYINNQSFSLVYRRQLTSYISRLIRLIDRGVTYVDVGNYVQAWRYVKASMAGCYSLRMRVDSLGRGNRMAEEIQAYIKNEAHTAGQFLADTYVMVFNNSGRSLSSFRVRRALRASQRINSVVNNRLQSVVGENNKLGDALVLSEEMMNSAQEALENNELAQAQAETLISRLLSLESLRLSR